MDDIFERVNENNYNFRILKKISHGNIFRLLWSSKHNIEQFMLLYDKSDIKLKRKEEEMLKCKDVLKNKKGRGGI